jgi:subtilisin
MYWCERGRSDAKVLQPGRPAAHGPEPPPLQSRPVQDVTSHGWDAAQAALPAWSLPKDAVDRIALPVYWPERVTRDWALQGSTGKGVRVCILDSGVDATHPLVGELESAVVISIGEDDEVVAQPDDEGDVSGHGTACAGIVRQLAPESSISSVRVLGASFTGSGAVLLGGLRYAIEQGFDVINMSLSTTKKPFATVLHELADAAYFKRTVLVASAHNMPVESYPWRFSSVISVGSHEEPDPLAFFYNPSPPVEFFGRGVNVQVPWSGGRTLTVSGNSFATPHIASICALVLSKHPELTPFQLKSVLYLTATNVGGGT